MVEPGPAARALRFAAAGQAAVKFELGLAVVIACRFGPGSLAAKAAFSLQQRRLAREESEIKLKFPGGDACAVGAAFLFQRPVVEVGRHTSELQSPKDLVCRLLLEK